MTDYRCEAPTPSIFYDVALLNLLAEMAKGENKSVRFEDEHGTLDCPIIVDSAGKATTGVPSCLPCPRYSGSGDLKSQRNLYDAYLRHLDSVASSADIRLEPLLDSEQADLRPWVRNGFEIELGFTTLVDLTRDEPSLLRSMRKTFPGYIRSISRSNRITAYSSGDKDHCAAFERWLELYQIVTARANATPSAAVEDMARSLFAAGKFELVMIEQSDLIVSGVLICAVGTHAYYWQGATHPDHENALPFTPALIWTAIKRCQERGVKHFEIGPVYLGSGAARYSQKEQSISFFKLGFGGRVVPWLTLSRCH